MRRRLVEEARRRLFERRAMLTRLRKQNEAHEQDVSGPHDPADWGELAAGEKQFGILERLEETELRELQEIDAALARLETDAYGECQACGQQIAERRLRAMPQATLCVDCASVGQPAHS